MNGTVKAILRNVAYFMVASVLSKVFGFAQSFALAKSLGPADFGVWVTLVLFIAYGPILYCGVLETLIKHVPYYRGLNDTARIKEVEDSVFGFIALSAGVLLAACPAAPFVLSYFSIEIETSIVIMTLLSIAVSYFSAFFYFRLTAHEDFKSSGIVDLGRSIAALVLVGGFGWFWGVKGAIFGYLLHEVVVCLSSFVLNARLHGCVGWCFRKTLLVQAVRIGFPITIVWWILILQSSVDRLIIGSLLGPLFVGYYSLGISILSALAIVPMVVGRVLYPTVNKQMGQGIDLEAMRKLIMAPTLALSALLANLLVALLAIMPFVYNEILPKYRPGLFAGEIIIIGSFFGCFMRNGANYLIASNKQGLFLKYVLCGLAFNVAANVAFVKAGWGIEGVATGTSATGLLLNTLVWRRVLLNLQLSERAAWIQMGYLYLPVFVLMLSAVVLRGVHHGFLQHSDSVAWVLSFLLFVLLNCILYCIPVYRSEMVRWKRSFARGKAANRVDAIAEVV